MSSLLIVYVLTPVLHALPQLLWRMLRQSSSICVIT